MNKAKWIKEEFKKVEEYLQKEKITYDRIENTPSFYIEECVAIWKIFSKKYKGKIGWWVISGDLPTDYISSKNIKDARTALEKILSEWKSYVKSMKDGKNPNDVKIGNKNNKKELGELLEKRINILEEWLATDNLWN